ncbi:MAG: TIGR03618 family F420-dependent PPOX class oxidoreductase [bacterium]
MNLGLAGTSPEFLEFWTERHLATLSTVRADGSIHVVPVGVTVDIDAGVARVITSGASAKARRIAAAGAVGVPATVSQVDGRRWSSLEGRAVVSSHPDAVADAVRRYAERYRTPRENPARVVIEITVTRALGLS